MQPLMRFLRDLPADRDLLEPEPAAIAVASDAELVRAVGQAIARPKHGGTSFTLHAPLELLARATLLQSVPPRARALARMRIASIASLYAEGDEVEPPQGTFSTVEQAKSALVAALREGDPDTADAAVVALTSQISAGEFCSLLADEIAPSLGAAAHTPLLLAALPDAAARYGNLSILLRAPIRALAADPSLRLTWIDAPRDLSGPEDLWSALADPPHVAAPRDSIAATMLAVESHGMAARLLGRATDTRPQNAARDLLRVAALAMMQDDPDGAPYGWSHCLTLPQGVMALEPYARDGDRLVRIAASWVLGFRATLGKVRLDRNGRFTDLPDLSDLAARAAAHEDAHLAKYTVACLAAGASDPSASRLFLAAANRLGEWWDARLRIDS
jgi:hypothetical protein